MIYDIRKVIVIFYLSFCLAIGLNDIVCHFRFIGHSYKTVAATIFKTDKKDHSMISGKYTVNEINYVIVEAGDCDKYSINDKIMVYYRPEIPTISTYRQDKFSVFDFLLEFIIGIVLFFIIGSILFYKLYNPIRLEDLKD